jgi:Ca2+-binding RTX toxin-like protein
MDISFTIPGCMTTGVCTACGGCTSFKPGEEVFTADYDPVAAGKAAAIIWEHNTTVWTNGTISQPIVLTYVIADSDQPAVFRESWDFGYKHNMEVKDTWFDYTAQQRKFIRQAADEINKTSGSGLMLIEVKDVSAADIKWHYGELSLYAGIIAAVNPDKTIGIGATLFANRKYAAYWEAVGLRPGEPGYAHILHEFGHMLNLKHPFWGKNVLPNSEDHRGITVMSHIEAVDGTYATGLRSLDKEALQVLFGKEADRHPEGLVREQWNRDGMVTIADDAGRLIVGINGRELIKTGAGDDTVFGCAGNDIIEINSGNDFVSGGDGQDVLVFERPIGDYRIVLHVPTASGTTGAPSGSITGPGGDRVIFTGVERFVFAGREFFPPAELVARTSIEEAMCRLMNMSTRQNSKENPSGHQWLTSIVYDKHIKLENMADWLVGQFWFFGNNESIRPIDWETMSVSQQFAILWQNVFEDVPVPVSVATKVATMSELSEAIWLMIAFENIADFDRILGGQHSPWTPGQLFLEDQTTVEKTTSQHIQEIFVALLGRSVHANEVAYHSNLIDQGHETLTSMVVEIIDSHEFNEKWESSIEFRRSISELSSGDGNTDLQRSEIDIGSIMLSLGFGKREDDYYKLSEMNGRLGLFEFWTGESRFLNFAGRSENFERFWLDGNGRLIAENKKGEVIELGRDVSAIKFVDGILMIGSQTGQIMAREFVERLFGHDWEAVWRTIDQDLILGSDDADAVIAKLYADQHFQQAFDRRFEGLSAEQFVLSQYRSILGRDPDAQSLVTQAAIIGLGADRQDVSKSFAQSSEFLGQVKAGDGPSVWWRNDNQDLTMRLYEATFNRKDLWHLEFISHGRHNIGDIIHAFMHSAEYDWAPWSDFSDRDWVTLMYRRVLEREPDAAGLESYTAALAAGLPRTKVLEDLILSDEHKYAVLKMNLEPTLVSADDRDVLRGSSGNDRLNGGSGADTLFGGSGDDTLIGGSVSAGLQNQLFGEEGMDTADYSSAVQAVRADLRGSAGFVNNVFSDYLIGIENLTGGSGDDTLVGHDSSDNSLSGSGGNDALYGFGGHDRLDGGAGADILLGGLGDDTLIGGSVSAGQQNQLFGEEGRDTADYTATSAAVYADLRGFVGFVNGVLTDYLIGIENLAGGSGDDTLVGHDSSDNSLSGSGGNDTLYGFGGHDRLDGGDGADILLGGLGDDTLVGGSVPAGQQNLLFGEEGRDTADYTATSAAVYADLRGFVGFVSNTLTDYLIGIENLAGGSGNDTLVGHDGGDNHLAGSSGNDALYGFGGHDRLDGGAGADILLGGLGDDTLVGGSVAAGQQNLLFGEEGRDTADYAATSLAVYADLRSGAGVVNGVFTDHLINIENLIGGSGNDTLVGDNGANVIAGGAGGDQLFGLGGADTFVYRTAADARLSAHDYLVDFQSGVDQLDFRALGIGASNVVIQTHADTTYLYAQSTGSGAHDMLILVAGANAVTNSDIVFA